MFTKKISNEKCFLCLQSFDEEIRVSFYWKCQICLSEIKSCEHECRCESNSICRKCYEINFKKMYSTCKIWFQIFLIHCSWHANFSLNEFRHEQKSIVIMFLCQKSIVLKIRIEFVMFSSSTQKRINNRASTFSWMSIKIEKLLVVIIVIE